VPSILSAQNPLYISQGNKNMDKELIWVKQAACINTPARVFFRNNVADDLQAIRICAECSVIDECLNYAIDHEEHGVWGGTTERERHKMVLAAAVNHLPPNHFRKYLPRILLEMRAIAEQRRNKRELEHPASVSPSFLFGMPSPQMHNPVPVVRAVVLQLVSFGTIYTGSLENRLPSRPAFHPN
jgi:hypothetical protein